MTMVRRFLIVTMAVLLAAMAPGFGSRAHAHEPASKQDLMRRVSEAARMLAGNPRAKGMSDAQRERLVEFVVGNMLFVLSHESGHAVIREMGIPVTGREEDAADIFATLMALLCADAFADRVLANAALGWFLSDRRDRRSRRNSEAVYYDEHGMDLQRAYIVVCLMVGSNIGKFAGVAEAAKLPAERQMTCHDDYLNAAWSWEQVLQSHLRKPDAPKTVINIVYGPSDGRYDAFAEVARHIQLLETMAEKLSDLYSWPAPISLELQTCGEANARWEFRSKKVVICYELAAEFAELYRMYGRSMAFTLGEKVSAATPRRESRQNRKTIRARRAIP